MDLPAQKRLSWLDYPLFNKVVLNAETIFWTEGYSSKASAKNAIESIQKNGPAAETVDKSD